jgi:hypothetical protein
LSTIYQVSIWQAGFAATFLFFRAARGKISDGLREILQERADRGIGAEIKTKKVCG